MLLKCGFSCIFGEPNFHISRILKQRKWYKKWPTIH